MAKKKTVDRKELIELYKITREEARHHDTINMQMFMGAGVVAAFLLAAIGYFFNQSFPLLQQHVGWVKGGILFFLAVIEAFFYQAFWRIDKYFEACSTVSGNIETQLKAEGLAENLLVGAELGKTVDAKCYLKWYRKWRLIIYLVVASLAFIAAGVLLFVFIKPCHMMIVY